jgi:hypothetical protein
MSWRHFNASEEEIKFYGIDTWDPMLLPLVLVLLGLWLMSAIAVPAMSIMMATNRFI